MILVPPSAWFALPTDDATSVGGKARSLVRLAAIGLPVPPAFVVGDALARGWLAGASPPRDRLDAAALPELDAIARLLDQAAFPPGFGEDLQRRLAALGGDRFAVRSSFASEDQPGALAAGVFQSRVDVAAADVPAALRAVLRSAFTPGAVAYQLAHGRAAGGAPLTVLVHPYRRGRAHGHAAWAPENGTEPIVTVDAGAIDAADRAGIHAALRRAAQSDSGGAPIAAGHQQAVELEWVTWPCGNGPDAPALWVLQLRPYAPPAPAPVWSGFEELPAGEDPDDWSWDVAHNPAPLSAAQAGLVALVDGSCRIGYRQRVLGGYLFYAVDSATTPPALTPAEARQAFDALTARVDAQIAALGPHPSLEAALTFFLGAYQPLLGEIGPAARRGRQDLRDWLGARGLGDPGLLRALLGGVPSAATRRAAAAKALSTAATDEERRLAEAAYIDEFGDEAPAWDVAVPTHREQPDRLTSGRLRPAASQDATGAATEAASGPGRTLDAPALPDVAARLDPSDREAFQALLADARTAAALAEDDDWLYARLQAVVRRALLDLGTRMVHEAHLRAVDDVFHWPLSASRIVAAAGSPPPHPQALADRGRRDHTVAAGSPPPAPRGSQRPGDGTVLRGWGTGGRAHGRVVHRDGPQGACPPPDAVLVARTLLPTELPLLIVAALVTDTGGPLDHVAAQARERGLPAVVGTEVATHHLPEGARVLVDADAGVVVRLTDDHTGSNSARVRS